ncbi:MAG: riboflavin biosynthesis protein RibD [Deltaproteobacteria bacterium HGW-Deltaproteobacteria-22]|nr:MAG: riboflavin biosynthesis protein RibD [Deltaproteobacteria bacterium HGW-Deltaproteobacteria-22]PKN44073.1 MAG: riboflavin biosynthesis protein RibD [Deltaproteobacteria bacterium HGW-Deltaproteobacteria-20]
MAPLPHDEFWMKRALKLAARGAGRTAPNPPVGAVVVKGGRVLGEGFHPKAGAPHAEVFALAAAGPAARGATLYVTLEPCAHTGRTPPCTLAILQAGLARVVYCVSDPNPLAAGGAAMLAGAGVEVIGGVLAPQGRELLAPFLSAVLRRRPFVELKMAGSLDGRAADRFGASRYITSEASLRRVHRMRDRADAVLVGGRTLELDDPQLTCRRVRGGRDPVRVILDPMLHHARPQQQIFSTGTSRVILCVCDQLPLQAREGFSGTNALFLPLPCDAAGRIRSTDLLEELFRLEIHHLLLEGGPHTAAAFLEDGVVDRVHFVYAPRLMLDRDAVPVLASDRPRRMEEPFALSNLRVRHVGPDLWIEGVPMRSEDPLPVRER